MTSLSLCFSKGNKRLVSEERRYLSSSSSSSSFSSSEYSSGHTVSKQLHFVLHVYFSRSGKVISLNTGGAKGLSVWAQANDKTISSMKKNKARECNNRYV